MIARQRAAQMTPKTSPGEHPGSFNHLSGDRWLWHWRLAAVELGYFQKSSVLPGTASSASRRFGYSTTGDIAIVGNWWVSFKTYWYAMTDTETWPLLATASIGLAAFCLLEWRSKISAARSLPVLHW